MIGIGPLRRAAGAAGRLLHVDQITELLSAIERPATEDPRTVEPPVGSAARELAVVGINLVGAGAATVGALARATRLPAAVPTAVSAVANVPQLRDAARARLGAARAERLIAAGESITAVFAGHPMGLLVNAVHGVQRVAEARARERVWRRRAPELIEDLPPQLPEVPRPEPLPPGPVERYAAQAAAAGMAGLVGGLLSARPQLRVAALAAASAKAARLTKESWASRVAQVVSGHDVVVVDSRAFRRFDRIDTVVIEADLLTTGRWVVEEVVPVDSRADPAELFTPALALLESGAPATDGWQLKPERPRGSRAHRDVAHRLTPGGRVLTLYRRGEPVAAVAAAPELDPYAEAVVAAAHLVGAVFVAGMSSHLHERLDVVGVVPGGSRLAKQVRTLQAEGHGVMLLARHGGRALASADCGVAMAEPGGPATPAGHLVCGPGLANVPLLLTAVPAARRAARAAVLTAGYGAAAGALVGVSGLGGPQTAGRNATIATNLAALAGIAAGVWYADPVVRQRPASPIDRSPWHAVAVPEVLRRLGSSLRGLSTQEADRRHRQVGDDIAEEGVGRATVHELDNPLTPALTAGAGLAAASGSTLDAALIGAVLGVNALVGGVQRWEAGRALRRLAERTAVPLRLRRDNHPVKATLDELVRGDIVELRAGDAIPADCRILKTEGLEVDEASLTGESLPVVKTAAPSLARQPAERSSMVYEGTAVAAGRAVAAVVAAGEATESHRVHAETVPMSTGGVQERLKELTSSSLPLALGGGAALLAANLLRGRPFDEAVAPAVSLTVAAVPEGLPSVATVAQVSAANRLSRRGVLVRNPAALESLGRVQTLCFDKTGTLTEGRLRLRLVSDGFQQAAVPDLPDRMRTVLAAALRASPRARPEGRLPHPTDHAVVTGGQEAGVTEHDGRPDWAREDELPFEPARGFHATLGHDGAQRVLTVKGAPEVVLDRCTTRLDGGTIRRLSAQGRQRLGEVAVAMARSGHRVLAVAEGPAPQGFTLDNGVELSRLRFVGFVALADRARPAAARAVETLRRAGVRVVMVTGDHPSTAEAVAAELRLLDGGKVMSGAEIDRCTDSELITVLPSVSVFARADPAHKVRVVRLLRVAGEAVAVTGDGANDAPAIRSADVGLALGSRATAAARQAADVVVTNNRIETVVDAVVEGRILWSSVREAVAVLLGGNLGEIGFTVAAGMLGATALRPRQLLLVNMLTDVVPAMALASRQPPDVSEEGLLAEGPAASLGEALTRDVRVRAAATAGAAAAAWLAARATGTSTRASTVALIALVAAQIGQTLLAGRRDPVVVGSCLVSLAALASAVQIPGLSQLLACRPVGPVGWGIGLTTATGSAVAAHVLERRREAGAAAAAQPGGSAGR